MQHIQSPADANFSLGSSKLSSCMEQHPCQVLQVLIDLNCPDNLCLGSPTLPVALHLNSQQGCRCTCLQLSSSPSAWMGLVLVHHLLHLELPLGDPWLLARPLS